VVPTNPRPNGEAHQEILGFDGDYNFPLFFFFTSEINLQSQMGEREGDFQCEF
jgi:hypothetical protein